MNDIVLQKSAILQTGYINDPNRILQDYRKEISEIEGYHGRELLELLQNAVDELTNNCERAVKVELCGNILRFSNNGNIFTEDGITSIMYTNISPKYNKSQYIGNKGTGFRSVLNWAKNIRIYSGDLSVEFSPQQSDVMLAELLKYDSVKKFKEKHGNLKVATLVAPMIIPSLPSKDYDTIIEITAVDNVIEDIERQMNEITSSTILFLEKLEQLSIIINGNEKKYIKHQEKEKNITFIKEYKNDREICVDEWLVTHKKYEENLIKYAITIAYKSDMTVQPSVLYCFFKTKISMPFPVLIHATLDLDASRNYLNQTESNKIVLKNICKLMVEIVKSHYNEVDYAPLKLLAPQKDLPNFDWLDFNFEEIYMSTIAEAAVFPNVNGKYISFNEMPKFYSSTNIADYLFGDIFDDLLVYSHEIYILKIINKIAELKRLSLRYSYNEIILKINQYIKNIAITQRAALCVRFISEYKTEMNSENRPNFIIDTDKREVLSHQQVFLPSEGNELPKPPNFASLVFMNKELSSALRSEFKANARVTADNLEHFRVREYAMQPLIQSVIAKFNERANKDSKKTLSYSVELIKWLWKLYKSGRIKNDEFTNSVTNIPLLNRAGVIVPANTLYLGKEYGNLIIENIYIGDNNFFVALPERFGISENEISAFAEFLVTLGVARFPRQKSVIVKPVPKNYIEMLSNELPYPVKFGWDGYFNNVNEFKKAKILQITVTILEHYEIILEKAKTEYILQWLMKDSASLGIITAKTESNDSSKCHIKWERKVDWRIMPNVFLSSYMRYEFSKSSWFEIDGNRYPPIQCFFKTNIKNNLLPYVIEPDLDLYIINAHQSNTEKMRIQSLLVSLGASESYSDLSTEALYGILLILPEKDKDGSISRALYRSLIDDKGLVHFERKNLKFQEFQKNGLVYCKSGKGFTPCSNVKYLTERMVSREVQKSFNLIDIPSRKSKEAIKKYLCVSALELKGKIWGTPTIHPLDDEFQRDFNHFKDFAFCYRVDIAKLPELSLMKSLKVRLCSELSADYENNKAVLDNYSFVRGADAVYLKISDSLNSVSAIRNDVGVSEAIAEIITSLADINDGEIFTKLCRLFSHNQENRQAILLREFDNLEILTRSKTALDSAIDIKAMFKTVCSGIVGGLTQEIIEIINAINFNEYHSLSNSLLFIKLLNALNSDVIDFNEYSEEIIHIDLRPFFVNELVNMSALKKIDYKNSLFASLKNEPISSQMSFINKFEKYINFIYQVANTKNINAEKIFFEQWDIITEIDDQTDNADSAWQRNRNIFENNKNKAIISDLLSDKVFDSLLYFGAFDELGKMYRAREKEIEAKTNNDDNVLESDANLVAQIEKINVTVPETISTKQNGKGNRKAGMVAERENPKWGAKAEKIVYRSFLNKYKNVKWVSENAKKENVNPEGIGGLGYDLTYIDDKEQIKYVEIKSTASDSISFMITANEIDVAERERENYIIALVTNVEKDDMRRIYEIENLFVYDDDESRNSNKRFQLSADNYSIRCNKLD